MSTKMSTPLNMKEVNEKIFSNLVINDFNNFQLAHAEMHEERSFITLIRFEEGTEVGQNYKISKIGFALVHTFNNTGDNKYYVLNSVEKTPENDEKYIEGMINFTVKLELANERSHTIHYINEETIFKSNGELIDFHILKKGKDTDGNVTWESRDTGGHMCKGKTTNTGG